MARKRRRGPLRRAVISWRRATSASDRPTLVLLVLVCVVLTGLSLFNRNYFPAGVLLVPMIVGSLWLGPRMLPWFVIFVCLCYCLLLADQSDDLGPQAAARTVITFTIALLILLTSFRRSRLGVSTPRGESMFVDLRDRISAQGDLPALPEDWLVESVAKTAGGTSFAGDFIVARRAGHKLELVVVDVSGKGVEAGSRSLFLSGAFNGIVSALPGEQFLPAANEYLLEQDWDEGFATAIHLHLDLATGDFELRKAGHPPAVWLHAGSGRWSILNSDGPILGLMDEADFEVVRGRLGHGDGLLLFTDGLVETAQRDISLGMDKLAGLGERLFQRGFDGGAQILLDKMQQTHDDRALVLVHRR